MLNRAVVLIIAWPQLLQAAEGPIQTRIIPKTGEKIGAVGLGTFIVFNFKDDAVKMEACKKVVQNMIAGGSTVIDTAPRYEEAEERVGDVVDSFSFSRIRV